MEGILQNNQVIQVIDHLCQKFGMAIDWSQQNVMPYIQELCVKYIHWKITDLILGMVVALTCGIGFGIFGIKKGFHFMKQSDYDLGEERTMIGIMILIISGIWTLIWGIAFINQMFELTKCIVFPELQLVEYIKSFM